MNYFIIVITIFLAVHPFGGIKEVHAREVNNQEQLEKDKDGNENSHFTDEQDKGNYEKTLNAVKDVAEIPSSEKADEENTQITLDFDNADIRDVIYSLGDILNINYIIDPKVRGTVNIHTSGTINVENIFPIFETILEVNDLTAVKVGDIYKIMRSTEVRKNPLIPQFEDEVSPLTSLDRMIFQIVPLRYASTRDIEKVLKRFKSKGGYLADDDKRNILFIVDTAANIKKMLSIIDIIDVSVFNRMKVRFFQIEHTDVNELTKNLEETFKALGMGSRKRKDVMDVNFIPIERMNVIIAVSMLPNVFETVDNWINKLDQPSDELDEKIYVYFVENARAEEIGEIIEEIYKEKTKVRRTRRSTRRRTKRVKRRSTKKSETASLLKGELKVVVDEVNNALIIRAIPQDYTKAFKTIKQLDVIPRQVLVEVLIAEVTLDKNTEFGVEWTFASDYASLGGYKGVDRLGQNFNLGGLGLDLSSPVDASGFTYAFASDALETFLRAYSRENEVKILSTPHILVADNTDAKIDVGEEVPIVTSEYTPTSLRTGESSSRSIEYRDTGILLTVTPRINDKGLVSMEVNQEVSNVSEQRIEGIDSPIILKRQAETSLVVQDGRTIVIGGLIRDQKEETQEGIPFLSEIPYLGMLFGYTNELVKKTELLFLITPHVIQNFEQAELLTQEFKEKAKGLKKVINQ
jgi:general secretion pathway protein D